MQAQVATMSELIKMILSKSQMTVTQLAERSEYHRTYIHYLKRRNTPVEQYPYQTVANLAYAAKQSVADLYSWAGIDVLATSVTLQHLEYEDLRLSPLISLEKVRRDIRLQQAINGAILARRYYYYDGDFGRAIAPLDRAHLLANDAGADRLATYLKIYLAQLCEMTGDLKRANTLCREAEKAALEIQKEGKRTKDTDLEWLGRRLNAQARVRRLWTNHWAEAITEASIPAGKMLIAELLEEDLNVPQEVPKVYYFLARCAVGLGLYDEALKYMRNAKTHVLSLQNPLVTPFELFLDTGISLEGNQSMYSWKEDQIITETADILVLNDEPEKALKEYETVQDHQRPRLYLSFFSWHNPSWQQLLKQRGEENAFGYSTEDWDTTVWSSGYLRLQAMTKYGEGQRHLEQGELAEAAQAFEATKSLSGEGNGYTKGCSAKDLMLQAMIALALVKAMQGNKALALSHLNMIKAKVEEINNRLIAAQYKAAFQRISQL